MDELNRALALAEVRGPAAVLEALEEIAADARLEARLMEHGTIPANLHFKTLPAVRVHPLYGTRAWHNQANTFHPDAAGIEYEQIVRHRRTLRAFAVSCVVRVVDLFRRWFTAARQFDWNVTYGDGSRMSRSEVRQVNATLWKHLACFQWQRGDVVAIDNFSVSHGRLPFHDLAGSLWR